MKNAGTSVVLTAFLGLAVLQIAQLTYSRIEQSSVRSPAAEQSASLPDGCQGPLGAMTSKACFTAATSHWTTVCQQNAILQKDPFFAVRLRDFAEETLFMGLTRLRVLNAELAQVVVDRLNLALVIRCEDFDAAPGGVLNRLFGNRPKVVGRFLGLDQAAEAVACGYGALCRERAPSVEGYRNPLFQEFLRAYGLDRMKQGPDGSEGSAPVDVPGVCSSTVFPSEQFPPASEVCALCARVIPKRRGNLGLSGDPARAQKAASVCETIKASRWTEADPL